MPDFRYTFAQSMETGRVFIYDAATDTFWKPRYKGITFYSPESIITANRSPMDNTVWLNFHTNRFAIYSVRLQSSDLSVSVATIKHHLAGVTPSSYVGNNIDKLLRKYIYINKHARKHLPSLQAKLVTVPIGTPSLDHGPSGNLISALIALNQQQHQRQQWTIASESESFKICEVAVSRKPNTYIWRYPNGLRTLKNYAINFSSYQRSFSDTDCHFTKVTEFPSHSKFIADENNPWYVR